MYLQCRFYCTGEFADFSVDDWLTKEKWFEMKVLVDTASIDKTVEMKSDTYAKHIKSILDRLNLS